MLQEVLDMLWWITLSSFRLIQQYSSRNKEITWHAISRLSKVDKTGINVVGKHNHMELKPSSLMHAPNICCETFYAVIIQVSEETSRISTCAQNPIGCVLTYFVMVLFLQQGCRFAETFLYHLAISALLHTISHFLKKMNRLAYLLRLSAERPWVNAWLVSAPTMTVGGALWAAVLKSNRGYILVGTEWNSQQQCFRGAVEL